MVNINRKRALLVVCLFLLYISWGSAFLGNKIALEFFPGFMLTGARFFGAGVMLLLYTYLRREKSTICRNDIQCHAINGIFLVIIGSGFVAKAQELNIPSGMAAVLYGAAPIWLMLGQWLFWKGKKPTLTQALGLLLGFSALAGLNVYQGVSGEASLQGLGMILFSTLAWVYGSHFSQVHQYDNNLSVMRSTGLLLLLGGGQTLIFSYIIGERVDVFSLPSAAYFSAAYLTVVSSLVAYTTYIWLLFNSRAIVAISYEYIVPVVAIILGAVLAGEDLNGVIIVASLVLIFSVFLITSHDRE